MATLDLCRDLRITPEPPDAAVVVTETSRVAPGWLAAVGIDPANPLRGILRKFHRPTHTRHHCGRKWFSYELARPGAYEVNSAWRSGRSLTMSFAVQPDMRFTIISPEGDPDATLAFLHGIDVAELAARRKDEPSDALPVLRGTVRQVQWASDLRRRRLNEAQQVSAELAELLARIDLASWWIAWRDAPLNQLPSAELFETSAKM